MELQYCPYAKGLMKAASTPVLAISTDGKVLDINEAILNISALLQDKLPITKLFDYFVEQKKQKKNSG
jgi:hypothetical protein